MMSSLSKTIDTLIPDIHTMLEEGGHDSALDLELGNVMEEALLHQLTPREPGNDRPWFSNIGKKCARQLWYSFHHKDKARPMPVDVRVKFLYGDLLEAMLLQLAKLAGHTVQHEQKRMEWNGLTGRMDAIIDGVVVDVKSASGYGAKKFAKGLIEADDAFGYIYQLAGYLMAAREEGLDVDPNTAAFLVIDKTSGALYLDKHVFSDDDLSKIRSGIDERKALSDSDVMPARGYSVTESGKSGNESIHRLCEYCQFKWECYPKAKTFLKVSDGTEMTLTKIKRVPSDHYWERIK